MAKVLSGSFNTNAYGERNLVFSWSATQSIEKNESYINWSLKGGGSGDQYYMAAPFTVKIAGETVYSSTTRIQLYKDTVVATGSKTIAHNNSGVKSFTASVEAAIYTFAVNCKGSATWELKDIPRAAEITSAPNFDDDANAITIVFSNPRWGGRLTNKFYIDEM